MIKISQLVLAMASADRAAHRAPTSPENLAWADQIQDRAAAIGGGDADLPVPLITAMRLLPGSPLETIVVPASAWSAWRNGRAGRMPPDQGRKNRMLAQDRKLLLENGRVSPLLS